MRGANAGQHDLRKPISGKDFIARPMISERGRPLSVMDTPTLFLEDGLPIYYSVTGTSRSLHRHMAMDHVSSRWSLLRRFETPSQDTMIYECLRRASQ